MFSAGPVEDGAPRAAKKRRWGASAKPSDAPTQAINISTESLKVLEIHLVFESTGYFYI